MSFKHPIIPLHIQYSYIYTWHNSPCLSLPLLVPLCSPFVSPSTYLAPSSCDRNHPPQSQVACKLTPFAPSVPQLSHPHQIPKPQLSSAKQQRPREYSGSCYPEQVYPVVVVDGCVLGWLMMVALHPLVEIDICSLGSCIMLHYIYIVVEVDGCESRVAGDVVVSSRWSG